ncbi:MAG: hypothetical protein DYG83_06130 [Candidatus Brocadia sp. AMX2]|uniref:Cytochrome c domain-containing protein n=1 Tax=Candidatus Brocadia sinica JPN1 TaxID=1197129 RepID=A0ABQ0K034_9BACT|nr:MULTISPECIES: hypothetical protein [Brocadia]KXK32992.1 MAG: hypothetical protein UZ01_00414 [Candidatus Brocadia sinica]MBC6932171.1 hypothetical protein [Candidatus Brocadia sp.]MBL1169440.1 hypothetical protein [Candidatus Brocadia sp. AMX1]NOG42251.1 hypothetical protein [Planctomycetota bacterium]KAA0245018.1 MAG: hypothetical protein EDM70_04475 [Candidatus Brocadia sp. AMX2]
MHNHKLYFYLVVIVAPLLIPGLLPFPVFSQNYVVNGISEKNNQEIAVKDSIVRKESLIIKDKRVYIRLVLDEGARNIANHKRYKERLYVLPKEVVYDEISRRIFYYRDNTEIEIGREKSFFGLMPYIALAEGITIISSPTDAKLLISANKDDKGILKSVIHSEENMEATLSKKCGQCHILEYIFSHKNWVEEDILHVFNRMQMEKEERFTQDEQEIIDLFKKYQKGEIDKGKLAEFESLKEISKKDVADFTEGVYMNNCVPCHNPLKISDVSLLYSKRRCKSVVDRMKEKEPSLFLQKDMDSLAGYLWEIKLRPCEN